jgi:hypothetical protein
MQKSENRPLLRMDYKLKIRPETMTLLEEHKGGTLRDIEMGKDFWTRS